MDAVARDFFTDPELIRDPLPYYTALRELGPVVREPHHGVFLVSGIEEILSVYADHASFSALVAPLGPFVKLPEPAAGETIGDVVRNRSDEIPLAGQLFTLFLADFDHAVTVKGAGRFQRFEVARCAVETDANINLPKLKTPGMMVLTGAIKSLLPAFRENEKSNGTSTPALITVATAEC